MYKIYIVILLTVIINNGFSQNKIPSKFYISAGTGINYPVYDGLNGSKFNIPLNIELGIHKENDWFFEIDYSWGKQKERTEYYKYSDTIITEYFYSEVKSNYYTIHFGRRFYLTNGPFFILSAGLTSNHYSSSRYESTNLITGAKYRIDSPGYRDNSATFNVGLGFDIKLSDQLNLYPVFKAFGAFYLFAPIFYNTSAMLQLRYTFNK